MVKVFPNSYIILMATFLPSSFGNEICMGVYRGCICQHILTLKCGPGRIRITDADPQHWRPEINFYSQKTKHKYNTFKLITSQFTGRGKTSLHLYISDFGGEAQLCNSEYQIFYFFKQVTWHKSYPHIPHPLGRCPMWRLFSCVPPGAQYSILLLWVHLTD